MLSSGSSLIKCEAIPEVFENLTGSNESGTLSLSMKSIIQVHVHKGERYFVAECLDLPVVTQGKTLDELAVNIKEAIALQLEGENPAEFGLAPHPSILASFELEPAYA